MVERNHFWQLLGIVVKGIDHVSGVLPDLNGDHGLEGNAEGVGVNCSVCARDDALLLELSHTLQAGTWRQTDDTGEFFVGEVAIMLEGFDDLMVDVIHDVRRVWGFIELYSPDIVICRQNRSLFE